MHASSAIAPNYGVEEWRHLYLAVRGMLLFADRSRWHERPERYLRPRTRDRIRREKLLTTVERGVRARGRLRRVWEHKVFEDSAETAATGEEAVRFRNWQTKHPWRTESVAPTALGEFVESRHFL